jgi:hypothetical protein
MLHTVHLLVDEIPTALARAAEALRDRRYRLRRLTVSKVGTAGRVSITAVVEAPVGAPVAGLFGESLPGTMARPAEPVAPFHWQADGAGDHAGN